jgi:hypothetical protein
MHKTGKQSSMDITNHGKKSAPVQPDLVLVTHDDSVTEQISTDEVDVDNTDIATKKETGPQPKIPSISQTPTTQAQQTIPSMEHVTSASSGHDSEKLAKAFVDTLDTNDRAVLNKIVAKKGLPGYAGALRWAIRSASREVDRD